MGRQTPLLSATAPSSAENPPQHANEDEDEIQPAENVSFAAKNATANKTNVDGDKGSAEPPLGETLSAEAEVKLVEEEVRPANIVADAKPLTKGIVTGHESPDRTFARANRVINPREEVERQKQARLAKDYAIAQSNPINDSVDDGDIQSSPQRTDADNEDAQRPTQPGEDGDKLSPGEVAYLKERRKAKSKNTSQKEVPRQNPPFRSEPDPKARQLSRSRTISPQSRPTTPQRYSQQVGYGDHIPTYESQRMRSQG